MFTSYSYSNQASRQYTADDWLAKSRFEKYSIQMKEPEAELSYVEQHINFR